MPVPQVRFTVEPEAVSEAAPVYPPRPFEPDEHSKDDPRRDELQSLGRSLEPQLTSPAVERAQSELESFQLPDRVSLSNPTAPDFASLFEPLSPTELPQLGANPAPSGQSQLHVLPNGKQVRVTNPNLVTLIAQHKQQIGFQAGINPERIGQCRDKNVQPPGGAPGSDHYWCGALDIPVNAYSAEGSALGDRIAGWARQYTTRGGGSPFKLVLWKVEYHFDHVHISYWEGWNGPLPIPPRFI